VLCDPGHRNTTQAKGFNARVISWNRPTSYFWSRDKRVWLYDKRVWLDVFKLEAMLRLEPSRHVGFAGENGIEGRYDGVDEFVASGEALDMPKVKISPDGCKGANGSGRVIIADGRHRFAWMRDHGAAALPAAVPADDADEVAKLIGTKARICRVTMWPIPEVPHGPPRDHADISLYEWEMFKVSGTTQQSLFTEAIDRADCGFFPDWFCPLARGAVIGAPALLVAAGHCEETRCLRDWIKWNSDVYSLPLGHQPGAYRSDAPIVRRCDKHGWWLIERRVADDEQVSVCSFGSTPILAPNHKSAMRLAKHCNDD